VKDVLEVIGIMAFVFFFIFSLDFWIAQNSCRNKREYDSCVVVAQHDIFWSSPGMKLGCTWGIRNGFTGE
jgi:hypothetical protein